MGWDRDWGSSSVSNLTALMQRQTERVTQAVAPAEADAHPTDDDERAYAMPTVDQIRHGITTRPTTMTCTVDGRDHLISEQATEAGQVAGDGRYQAICERLVTAAPLVVAPGPTCLDCETALHRSTTTAETTSHRRTGLLAWLLRRRYPRADPRSESAASRHAARA